MSGSWSMKDLLSRAKELGASDLHISAGSPPLFRVKGVLEPEQGASPLSPEETQRLCYSVMSDVLRKVFEEHGSVDFSFQISGIGSFRANVFRKTKTVAGAFRMLPEQIPPLDTLGFVPDALSIIKNQMLERASGFILVTGPTGSGKSTTIASMIDYLLEQFPGIHVITIEDPIEYRLLPREGLVSQREVGSDVESFSEALRYVLRQDPDVVMIGEMRDPESIAAALTIAETGHLVLSTLHSNSVRDTVNRIVDAFPADKRSFIRVQLASVITGIVSQRLVPGKDGRYLAAEVMFFDEGAKNMIREGNQYQLDPASRDGVGIRASLEYLVSRGKIFPDDVRRYLSQGSSPERKRAKKLKGR